MPRGTCTIYNGTSHNIKNEYGVSLSDGAISTLLAWADTKERITNESRLEDGKRVDEFTPTKFAARTITLEMHLIAPDFATFLAHERAFIAALTASPLITLTFAIYGSTMRFRLRYLSCTQFAVYNGTLGKFAVRFEEPIPNNGQLS
jgi:hypothetical protein